MTWRDQGVRELEEPHAGNCKGQGFRAGPRALTWASGCLLCREGMGAGREVPSPEALSPCPLPCFCSLLFLLTHLCSPVLRPPSHLPDLPLSCPRHTPICGLTLRSHLCPQFWQLPQAPPPHRNSGLGRALALPQSWVRVLQVSSPQVSGLVSILSSPPGTPHPGLGLPNP